MFHHLRMMEAPLMELTCLPQWLDKMTNTPRVQQVSALYNLGPLILS